MGKVKKRRRREDGGITFEGREAEHPEFGQRVLDRFKEELSDISEIESTSKPDGKSLTMVLAPNGVKK